MALIIFIILLKCSLYKDQINTLVASLRNMGVCELSVEKQNNRPLRGYKILYLSNFNEANPQELTCSKYG